MAKIILAVAMLSAVVVSNVAHADGYPTGGYQPGDYYNAEGGVTTDEFEHP